jgi:diamine N-acetyltransferase
VPIHFEPITLQNRHRALALSILPSQKGFVESVAQCLKEADERSCWRPVLILSDGQDVGFAMYCLWKDQWEDRVWLDRLFIDARYQHHGLGRAALNEMLQRLYAEYGNRDIYLSVVPENHPAIALYESFGFAFNGELDIHDEKVMVKKYRP